MVLNELKERGVPAFGQEEAGGIVTAMPLTPTPGPDVTWIVRVPESAVSDAKQVIGLLPVEATQTPDVWHFGPTPFGRTAFRVGAFLSLGIGMVWLLIEVFQFFVGR